MLNGKDPILIFSFFKDVKAADEKDKSAVAKIINKFALPPIPIYLSSEKTGLFVAAESKNIDIETSTDGLLNQDVSITTQKPINTTTKVTLHANKTSTGLQILTAVADLIFPKLVAQDYSLTYINNGTTIFGGLLHAFSIDQDANSDLIKVNMEIVKITKKKPSVDFDAPKNSATLNNTGAAPTQIPEGGGTPTAQPPTQSALPLGRQT